MKPSTARVIHLILMAFWGLNVPIVMLIYLYAPHAWEKGSILYLALVSIYANFVGHWSGLSAERPTEIHDPKEANDT